MLWLLVLQMIRHDTAGQEAAGADSVERIPRIAVSNRMESLPGRNVPFPDATPRSSCMSSSRMLVRRRRTVGTALEHLPNRRTFQDLPLEEQMRHFPASTVETQTFSSVSANLTTSGVLSNLPRYLRPCVHAKIDAIGLVEVSLPFWCSR